MTRTHRPQQEVLEFFLASAGTSTVRHLRERLASKAPEATVYDLEPYDLGPEDAHNIFSVGISLTAGGERAWLTMRGEGVSLIEETQVEIQQLWARVAVLEEEVEALKSSLQVETIVLRTVSREQAKEEIRQLFQSGETLFYSDIARRLRIDLPMVVEICQELTAAGEIEVHDNAA